MVSDNLLTTHLLGFRLGSILHQRKHDINVSIVVEGGSLNALSVGDVAESTATIIDGGIAFHVTEPACKLAYYAMAWDIENIENERNCLFLNL